MPSSTRSLTPKSAADQVGRAGFSGATRASVGVELEWLPCRLDDPEQRPDPAVVQARAHAAARPGGSRLTFEPGGQVELSSAPGDNLDAVSDAIETDARSLRSALGHAGIGLLALGLDPRELAARCLREPRYAAMERYFDADGIEGRTMMCGTAAIQVNVGLGASDELRWQRAHRMAPVLAAAFANSPLRDGAPSGWHSTRLAIWSAIDAARSAPVDHREGDRAAWVRYALDAPVMFVRVADDDFVPLDDRVTFRDWIEQGHALGHPTSDDLAYHLTTLFPPVRPRGWLELRFLDALPHPWWRVAFAVTTALVTDGVPELELPDDPWTVAARDGLGDPHLAEAARVCFATARESLRDAVRAESLRQVDEYTERFVAPGRSPADDVLDAWKHHGTLVPPPETYAA